MRRDRWSARDGAMAKRDGGATERTCKESADGLKHGCRNAGRREGRADPARDRPSGVDGIRHSSLDRRVANGSGRRGRSGGFRSARRRSARRRARSRAHHAALQTGQPRVSSARNRGRVAARRAHRRHRSRGRRGAMLGGDVRTDRPDCGARREGRREDSCAAARSSRAARRTVFRGTAKRAWS